jgi:hypothetical protein
MDYVQAQANATEKIRAAGAAAILTRTIGGEYNPAASGVTGGITETYPTSALRSSYTTGETDGRNVVRGDLRLMVPASDGFVPQEGDTITIRGEVFRVVGTDPFSPGDTNIYFIVQARK